MKIIGDMMENRDIRKVWVEVVVVLNTEEIIINDSILYSIEYQCIIILWYDKAKE